MFSSYVLYDTVAIEAVYFPHHAALASTDAHSNSSNGDDDNATYELTMREIVLHRLTERYVGRIIPSRGLCVAITEVMEYSASSVRGTAASAWLTATFGVCVFAPRPGTRLKARIAHQDATGVHLTLDLFVAIPFLVPAVMLVPGSRYHAAQRSWYLPLEGNGGEEGEGESDAAQDGLAGGSGSTTAASTSTCSPSVPHNRYVVGAEVIVKVVSCNVLSEEAVVAAEEAESNQSSAVSVCGPGGGSASVVSFAALPSAAAITATSELGGNAASEGPLSLMELRGSFLGDALGPVSWFEDA
jgi:DNA-directed RNA polymerase III subunit RPC8